MLLLLAVLNFLTFGPEESVSNFLLKIVGTASDFDFLLTFSEWMLI